MRQTHSDEAVDAYVEAQQNARLDARKADPRWRLVEANDGLPGFVWQEVKEGDNEVVHVR